VVLDANGRTTSANKTDAQATVQTVPTERTTWDPFKTRWYPIKAWRRWRTGWQHHSVVPVCLEGGKEQMTVAEWAHFVDRKGIPH
jgi:hypothetical protein